MKKPSPRAASPLPGAVPPDLGELLDAPFFRDPRAARARLGELYRDAAEMLALARLSGLLGDLLGGCPDPDAALLHLTRFVEVRGSRLQLFGMFLDHPALLDRFVTVVGASRYLADILVRNPHLFDVLSDSALLSRPRPRAELEKDLARVSAPLRSEEEKLAAVRRIHRREMLRIGSAELLGFQDLPTAAGQVSDLADAFVARCLSIVSGPHGRGGLVVLALGKWGGRELNYSSDVDVVFLARRPADVPGASRLARRLIRALSEPTYEGVVYRVDLRLRPYGSEGTLVATASMFEEYLRGKARPAERQMMLKARAAAGAVAAGRRFLSRVAPVVLQDAPSARAQVRRLKARIERQLQERGQAGGHLKLAPGGIRDVEFLVQALQLEAGPSRRDVLGGNTLEALRKLERAGLLGPDDAQALREAYVFLRAVEHRMQLMENQQVYRLPRGEEELRRLGRSMGFAGPDADRRLLDAYDARARRVRAIFDRVLGPPAAEGPRSPDGLEGLRRQLGAAGERLDPGLLRRCAEALEPLRRPGDVRMSAQRNDRSRWTVVIGAADPGGLLPLVAGLFAARRADVRSGDFMTLPSAAPRNALGVFDVSIAGRVSARYWDSFREELSTLAAAGKPEAARGRVLDRVAEALRPSGAPGDPLLPIRIETRNDEGASETELHLRSPDSPGFLFEFSAALAALGVEVRRAVIRTLDDEVYDTFWITDARGRKITGERALEELRAAAALVRQFMHLLPRSPDPAQALRQFTALLHQMFGRPEWVPELRSLESASVLSTIADLMGVSRFLWEDFLLLQHESLFPVVRDVGALGRRTSKAGLRRELARVLSRTRDPETFSARLNEFKDREMFRIDLRHITRRSSFEEFMASLSDLADEVVSRAAARVFGRSFPWSVSGLGKFGGRELGIASDLDLVVVYDGEGAGGDFNQAVRSFQRMLRARREGSFEIDLRLRPHGDSGAPACSLGGFLQYYSDGGPARPFERLALVKLRPVAGSPSLGARLLEARDRFVYSERPVDLENLLHLRRRQAAELVPSGGVSAKYSPGGLVDVEYFVQARQIEAGRADPSVRVPHTLEAIDRLVRGGHLRRELGAELESAYLFLRRLIDAQRVVRGHGRDATLPPPGDREFAYLVRRLGYASSTQLEAEIRQRMSFARHLWGEVNYQS